MAADLEQGGIHLHQLSSDISPNRDGEDRTAIDNLCKVDESRLNSEELQRLHTWEDAIQPHTNEFGDTNYIGDVYNEINELIAAEWHLERPGDYLRFVKSVSQTDVELKYLAHWMEVSTSPLKWRFLRQLPASREERARRVRACILDYSAQILMRTEHCESANVLRDTISTVPPDCKLRIIIAEDLSRDLIEALGIPLDLDPRFFREYIGDSTFFHSTDPWISHLIPLSKVARQSHMTFSFLRARYYASELIFQEAYRQCGKFNVLRRLDSDRSRIKLQQLNPSRTKNTSVALARSKFAVWFRKENDLSPVIALLLCDPTTESGKPLWMGTNTAQDVLRPSNWVDEAQQVGRTSLFDQVTQAYGSLAPSDIEHILERARNVAQPALKIMIKEWLLIVRHMRSQVAIMQWELDKPEFGSDYHGMLSAAESTSPWRKNLSHYKNWVQDVLDYVSVIAANDKQTYAHPTDSASDVRNAHIDGLEALIPDLERIIRRLDEIAELIERVSVMASSAMSRGEARQNRRALLQNRSLGWLSVLATIFLPLNFATSFLSMSSDFSASQNTVWLFFAIGIPLTVIVVSFIGCMRFYRMVNDVKIYYQT
ncbi:hypothetical protein CB0940_02404 [Cercospora beticola]|uniref:Magnesium transport protein CorA n=1 Tax=Cercospora beticola TaxID=122368 RepID=A0A2G5I1Y9_CERBT|nr:hypothetical protein CB0940_02404 [Cercospora beticola]PIA98771.1 hypothetical protein CB0940_02404 [Cercospora beticola]WPA99540.1 hypothetical protein RHO25_004158 [Cercospora beticola]CAK1362330.1 unnamed protein product [Cercospora beticola]